MVQCAVFAGKEIKDCTRGEACICAKHAVGAGDALTNKCVYGPKDGCISAALIMPFLKELDCLRAENERLSKLVAACKAVCRPPCDLEFNKVVERAERAEADNAKLREENGRLNAQLMQSELDRKCEAALRGGVVVPEETLEACRREFENEGLFGFADDVRRMLAAAKEGKS